MAEYRLLQTLNFKPEPESPPPEPVRVTITSRLCTEYQNRKYNTLFWSPCSTEPYTLNGEVVGSYLYIVKYALRAIGDTTNYTDRQLKTIEQMILQKIKESREPSVCVHEFRSIGTQTEQ